MQLKQRREALLPGVAEMTADFPQRIPYPAGNEAQRGIYGTLTNGQRMTGHLSAEIEEGVRSQSRALMGRGALPASLREMIIVRVGYLCNSTYEVEQHLSLAIKCGVPAEKLDALACRNPAGLGDAECAVIDFVDDLVSRNRPRDEILERVLKWFGISAVMEMIFVTGNWWTLARMLETAGVPLDESRIGDRSLDHLSS